MIEEETFSDICDLMRPHEASGHGYSHCLNVYSNGLEALKECKFDSKRKREILLACLLHDADDPKIFATQNNENALKILKNTTLSIDIDNVIKMINLVSFRNNQNTKISEDKEWMLIPRDCDRVEALGGEGIKRCLLYTLHIRRDLFTEKTPRPKTEKELDELLSKGPSEYYLFNNNSETMIDHYYDKLLRLRPSIKNKYLENLFKQRLDSMRKFILDFSNCEDVNRWKKDLLLY